MDWKILFYTVIVICLLYLYLSVFVVAYSIWKDRDLDKEPIWRVKILNEYFFFIGAWFALGFFFWGGFEKALFFLPDSWGLQMKKDIGHLLKHISQFFSVVL